MLTGWSWVGLGWIGQFAWHGIRCPQKYIHQWHGIGCGRLRGKMLHI